MIKIKCKDINKKEVKELAKLLGINDVPIIINEVDDRKRTQIANYYMKYKTIDGKRVKIIKEKIQVFLYKEYPLKRTIINYSHDTICEYEFQTKLEELMYALAHEAYHRKYFQ